MIKKSLALLTEKLSFARVVIGGVHASFSPEDFADYQYDVLVRGEGENFVESLLSGDDYTKLPGVFKKGEPFTHDFVPIVKDLNSIPHPLRYLSPRECSFRLDVLTQRGCPFSCSYCVNGLYHKVYGRCYLRHREPENVIREIKNVPGRYKHLMFLDDNFLGNRKWSGDLFDLYSKEVRLPFTIKTRPSYVTDDILSMLKKSGCFRLQMGIEHGNPAVRKELMGRNESDEQIVKSFKMAKSAGFETTSYNILGLPDDTEDDIVKLIDLNRRARPDHMYYTIFQPYPATPLAEYAGKKNITYHFWESYFRWDPSQIDTLPELPGITKERLSYYFTNFTRLVKNNKAPLGGARETMRLPKKSIFGLWRSHRN